MTTLTDLGRFNGLEPFSDVNPWEEQAREEEAARKRTEKADRWKDMTHAPMDWQRYIASLDIPAPAKILGMVMSHHCGPNSHGCSASIGTLAEKAHMSRAAVDRAVRALKKADLIREVGTGMAGNKIYRIGYPRH